MSESKVYRFQDIWFAVQHEKDFDYVFWIDILLQLVAYKTMKAMGYVMVAFALALITIISYSGLFYVLPRICASGSGWFYFNYTFGPFLILNICFNYLMGICTNPGNPDKISSEPLANMEAGEKMEKVCGRCNRKKPSRTHHCSICGTCILKMDHHCPWLNNCVGYRNYRYFYLFLLWTAIATGYVGAITTPTVFKPDGFLFGENGVLSDLGGESIQLTRILFLPFFDAYDYTRYAE